MEAEEETEESDDNDEKQHVPKRVAADAWEGRRVVSVTCGKTHTAVVLDDGSLYTFGDGEYGLLGHGDTQVRFTPTRVALPYAAESEPPAVVGIAISATIAAAWTADGRVFSWGKTGVHGELGGAGAAAVPATGAVPGEEHAVRGQVVAYYEQLGYNPSEVDAEMAEYEGREGDLFAELEEEAAAAVAVAAAGADCSRLLPREVAGLPVRAAHRRCRDRGDHVVDVMLTNDHSAYARTARGRVFAWGRGIGGQLGLGATDRDHHAPRLMGPVQGRCVSGVFAAHDATVWVAFVGAADTAAAGRDEEQPAASENAGGGIVANPIVVVTVGVSDCAGGTACV
jgi:hypothetical protein